MKTANDLQPTMIHKWFLILSRFLHSWEKLPLERLWFLFCGGARRVAKASFLSLLPHQVKAVRRSSAQCSTRTWNLLNWVPQPQQNPWNPREFRVPLERMWGKRVHTVSFQHSQTIIVSHALMMPTNRSFFFCFYPPSFFCSSKLHLKTQSGSTVMWRCIVC